MSAANPADRSRNSLTTGRYNALMRTRLTALLALAAAALLAGCSSGPSAQNLRPGPRESVIAAGAAIKLPARRCANYFLISTTINGRGPYAMLLDTGASQTVVSSRVARDLAADIQPVSGNAIGSQGRTQKIDGLLQIRTMNAGELELRNFSAIALDLRTIEAALGTRLDGILGYEAFRSVLLTIDYPNSEVRVERGELPDENNRDIVSLTSFDAPNVEVRIGDKRRIMLIDSGKGAAFSLRRLETLPTAAPIADVSSAVAVGGGFVSRSARLSNDMVLGGTVFKTPIVDASDNSNLIGAAAFADMALTFDQRNQRLRITPRSNPTVTFPPIRGIGAAFDFSSGSWKIGQVFPNSTAELAGLKPGDILIRFNGRRLSELACKPASDMFATGNSVQLDVIRQQPRQRLSIEVPIAILVP